MATYYIDPTWTGTQSGTFAAPFDSWADVTWAAGNTYLQKESTTFAGSVTVGTGGTSAAALVVLGTYDATTGDRLILNPKVAGDAARMAKINANGSQLCIIISNGRNFTHVADLEVYGARHTSSATGIYAGSGASTDNVVQRCYIHDIKHSNQSVGSAGVRAFCLRLKVLDCRITDIGDDGIYCEGTGIEIARNHIDRCSAETVGGDCVQMANSLLSVSDFWIHDNLLDHSDKDCKQCFIVTTVGAGGASTGGIVENNEVRGYIGATSHKPLYIGSAGAIVRWNTVSGGIRGIDLVAEAVGAEVYGNVITNASAVANTNGIVVTANDQVIYGNTIANVGSVAGAVSYGVHQASTYTGVVVKNNVLHGWVHGLRVAATNPADESYNSFFGSVTANKVNNSLTPQALGTGSITADPLLSSDYRPKPSSPLLAAGTHLGYGYKYRDANGKQRQNPPAIGAYDAATLRRVLETA